MNEKKLNDEETITSATVSEDAALDGAEKELKKGKKNGPLKKLFGKRAGKLKNQALLRRGGYSVAISALVLAALILFNWLVSVLADRFNLEFDMSTQHINTISEENLEYIRGVTDEVTVTVCAGENDYANYISYYAQNLYNATAANASEYYRQTVNLINRYADYNKKITVRFVDPQTTAFTEISTKYAGDNLSYGDVIVSAVKTTDEGQNERHKTVRFEDIYVLTDETDGYAAMGYGSYTITGNNIETSLTSAIAYVTSTETKRALFLTGHSAYDYTASYSSLLKTNNYEIDTNSSALITEISDEYDLVIIVGPSVDFVGSELDILSAFLDNDGRLGKGLIFFGDATGPALPNLYEFLSEWGIQVSEGILFETDENNHIAGDRATMGIYSGSDAMTSDLSYCITGYNVPITETSPVDVTVTVSGLMLTSDTVVKAPVGASNDWNNYTDADLGQYMGVVQAEKLQYDSDNQQITSYVMAFSSIGYTYSQWAEYSQLSNQDITLLCADRAAGVEDPGISFLSKTITNESFANSVTEAGTMMVRTIFMIALPVCMILLGIYIFIRRRNA